eukprot:TRINITY_DN2638_c0_g2_i2.p1 TRINITY_DN2638_c0_g2~~TRINITY_DN2638_c0_g2_i2.p1  ORF type:complete len:264 (+),score=87.99 TRINITY_DN2638_c0_g2_i2:504-1295(+)
MDKAIPIHNRHLTSRWNQRAYDIHRKKLNKIKGSIDNAAPKQYSHIQKNYKRSIKEEERCEEIFKENQMLLTKIAVIKSSGGSVDTQLKTHRKQETLHEAARRREFERIDRENGRLLNRIKQVNPTYKREEWKAHGKKHAQYLKHMVEFPNDPTGAISQLEGGVKSSRKLSKTARKSKENRFDENDEDLYQPVVASDNDNEAVEEQEENVIEEDDNPNEAYHDDHFVDSNNDVYEEPVESNENSFNDENFEENESTSLTKDDE